MWKTPFFFPQKKFFTGFRIWEAVIFPQIRNEKSSFFRQKVLLFGGISFIMIMLAVKYGKKYVFHSFHEVFHIYQFTFPQSDFRFFPSAENGGKRTALQQVNKKDTRFMEQTFSHISVLLHECIEALDIKPDGIYVDCTLGGGGHSLEIVKRLENGKLICIDQDAAAIAAAR